MKQYLFAVFAAFLLLFNAVSAQQFSWAYGEGGLGGDVATAITHDADGNIYVTGNVAGGVAFGNTFVSGTVYEVFLAKYNAAGSLQWVKSYGGLNNEKGMAVAYSNNAIYLCGFFEGSATFGATTLTSKGGSDVFVAKVDLDGNVLWAKQAGSSNSELATGVAADANGNIYVCGTYRSSFSIGDSTVTSTNSSPESFIFSLNTSGDYRWLKTTKGTSNNSATGIACNPQGGVVVCGYFGIRIDIDGTQLTTPSPSYDMYLASYGADGQLNWAKKAGSSAEDQAYAVTCDNSGNAYLVGYYGGEMKFDNITLAFSGYNDAFVAKYDNAGNVLWAKGAGGGSIDFATSVALDEDDNCYVGGVFDKYAYFNGVQVTGPDENIFLASYDKNGALRFVQSAGGVQTDAVLGLAVTNKRAFLVGYYWFTCYFGNIGIPMADNSDLFVAAYDIPEVTGLAEVSTRSIKLYPNPAKDIVTIETKESITSVDVTDITGKLVFTNISLINNSFDVSSLTKGIYHIRLKTADGMFFSNRLVKTN